MAHAKAKKEHAEHEDLLDVLKKHFLKDEHEMEEDEERGSNHKKNDLMSILKKTFLGEDGDSEEDDMKYDMDEPGEDLRSMKKKRRKEVQKPFDSSDEYYEGGQEPFDQEEFDDKDFENSSEMEPQEDSEEDMENDLPMVPKDQRKRMAIAVISKRMSKPKR